MLPSFVPLRFHHGSRERKTVVEVCEHCLNLHVYVMIQTLSKSTNFIVKMRGKVARNQRGILKHRHGALALPLRCKACSKHSRGGIYAQRRQYVTGGLLCFSVLFLFIVMVRSDWFSLFSDSQTVQLIPIVHRFTGHAPTLSGSLPKPYSLNLKDEGIPLARPKGGLKDVLTDQNHNSSLSRSNPLGLSNDIKVFIYDLPHNFNKDWLKDARCSNHLFAAEVAIHLRLLQSPVRTFEPSEANYFFMPVYLSCNFNTTSGFPSIGHARSVLGSAVKLVSQKMPYWNHSKGEDHIFAATHDYGPCFHTMEDLALASGIPSFLRNSIILQTFGRTDGHACQAKNSITIPSFVQPPIMDPDWRPELERRDIWAFFRGKMEIHPRNVSGPIYSRGVRSTIWQKRRRNRRFFIKRTRSQDYQAEIRRSVYCLCPLGWAPWSPRIVESVIFGCVPVIIADKIALPYSHIIKWDDISITIPEKHVSKLGKILDKVAHKNLSTIQQNLWNKKYRQALLYMDPLIPGDATWQILELLSRKATNRSHRSVQSM